jgi:hypothetical protein
MTEPRESKSQHPLYAVYWAMRDRCYNRNHEFYSRYGARGIRVCPEWLDPICGFQSFLLDMGKRPEGTDGNGKSLWSIDRVDNDRGYCKDNCRWATSSQQQRNRRNKREDPFPGYGRDLLASLAAANVKSVSVYYP